MYVYVHVKKSSVRARVRMPTCCDVWRRRVRIFGYYLSLVSSQFGVSVCTQNILPTSALLRFA